VVKAFAYVDAANEREALAALSGTRGRVLPLAGGQDLIALMKDYVLQPEQVVNVKGLDATIAATPDGGLRIGSAVRLSDLAIHPDVRARYAALAGAASEVGTPQIRHVGTVGGNLCQRPRCWYFRNEEFNCLKKAGPRCYAVEGENQFHAIFGGGPCFIVHPSSLAVPLVAFGARMRVAGPSGEREVPAGEFFVLPEQRLMYETVMEPNELLTHVTLPRLDGVRSATYEVRYKRAFDWPIAFATAALTVEGSRIAQARVVMGAVAPIPWRSAAAERALEGQSLGEEAAERAAAAAVQEAQPMTGNGYKVQVARTAVKRAVLEAAGLLNV
jgi:xanthine dehydrogenase YagS FAD-binding subunit